MTGKKVYVPPEVQYWSAEELNQIEAQMSGGSGEVAPLDVRMLCFSEPTIYGQPMFTATANKPAIITFCLDGEEVYNPQEGDPSQPRTVASYTAPRRLAAGPHSLKVIAMSGVEKANDTCSWTTGCSELDDNSPFINFEVCEFRCEPCDWKEAVCTHNALINLARNGALSQWQDQLINCSWRQRDGCNAYPFITSSAPTGKDLYYVSIESPQPGFEAHAVVGELIGDDVTVFENWKFIQYGDLDIKPGNPQMPFGYGDRSTTVKILRITSLSVRNCYIEKTDEEIVMFLIDNWGEVK